jgi:hypothetical protein
LYLAAVRLLGLNLRDFLRATKQNKLRI